MGVDYDLIKAVLQNTPTITFEEALSKPEIREEELKKLKKMTGKSESMFFYTGRTDNNRNKSRRRFTGK